MKDFNFKATLSLGIIIVTLFMNLKVHAGVVRAIVTDDNKMNSIHLRLGKSTVLRFHGDRPKKVVIGNQNYYNVEFVEGTSDVTLQPLQAVPTNLFVYCQKKIYGFLIHTKNTGNYDDLVNIYWKPPKTTLKVRGRIVRLHQKRVKRVDQKIQLSSDLSLSDFVVTSFKNQKRIIIDFKLANSSKETIDLKRLEVFATRRAKKLEHSIFLTKESKLLKFEKTKARFIINLKIRRGFTLIFHKRGIKQKLVIKSRYLK